MRLTFILFSTLFLTSAFGQFSNNKEKFVKEFQKKLTEYGKGDFRDFAKEEFPLLLQNSSFSDAIFSRMVTNANAMEEKRMKIFPDIYNYVYSVSSFVKNNQSNESFSAWHSTSDGLFAIRNPKKFKDFLSFSAGFFDNKRIAVSPNFIWYYEGGNYNFEEGKSGAVNFEKGRLICRVLQKSGKDKGMPIDSLVVYGTNGKFQPGLKKWEGEGGTVNWEKVGIPKADREATLTSYSISMKNAILRVDEVTLISSLLEKEMKGSLVDRAMKINREQDKIFPQFLSLKEKAKIDNIVEGVNYFGGVSFQGDEFVGIGTAESPAEVNFVKEGESFGKASGLRFYFSPEKMTCERARVFLAMNEGKDSLTHPGINVLFEKEGQKLQLQRSRSGIGSAPFNDSYHKLDIYVDKVSWEGGLNKLNFGFDFGTSQEQRVAQFESQNYFNERLYDRLQGVSSAHPLVALWNYAYKYDEYVLTEGKAATALGRTVSEVKELMLTLSSQGFISYDQETKTVTINKKLENFVKAKSGKIDYDNIVFYCDFRPKKIKNATPEQIKDDPYLQSLEKQFEKQNRERKLLTSFGSLDLKTMDLSLKGVDRVIISANKNTLVFPENGDVSVRKNRDFEFKGWMNAGKLEVNAELASFNYDEFKFKLQKSHESLFRVAPMDPTHGENSIAMISEIHGVTGEVLIDDPSNRSGKKKEFEAYPKLNSINKTYVYYNDSSIFRGAYDSTRFYYTVNPFEKDSLNTFSQKALRLKGELVSGGIFPKIKEDLKIMPDYSFGFSTVAPEGGLDFYDSGAKYDNKIVLSGNGLQGKGEIKYMNATAQSPAFSFLPDSTVGFAKFDNKPSVSGVEFPDVTCKKAFISYVPKGNVLKATSTKKEKLVFFDKEATMRGTVKVRPNGMRGSGLMEFRNAMLSSNDFDYSRYNANADTAVFKLRNDNEDLSEDALAFKTTNVKAEVSFEKREGMFYSNEGESKVEFPVNQYVATMDQFKWSMDELTVEMSKKEETNIDLQSGVDLAGSNFFSTNPKQDSLQFRAPKAKFDIKSKSITCDKVEYLDVADARIYPDSMRLIIRKKAKMDPLKNSKIVANYVTKYHTFSEADVEITARRNYSGKGMYPYYDRDSNVTMITIDEIKLNEEYQTTAKGKIEDDANFKLSPEFDYYGEVHILATNPSINFSGATRINHSCDKFDKNWMAFEAEIDPKNIQIPVAQQMKDLKGNPISAGIVWRDSPSTDSLKLYPTFLSSLIDAKDPIVVTSSGFLQYDAGAKEFQIGSKEKLLNRNAPGNFIALHTESCSMNGIGSIDLGMDYGDLTVDAVGVVNYNQETGVTDMNLTLKFNMPVDKGLFQGVAERVIENGALKPLNMNTTTLEQAIAQWSDQKTADKFKEEFVQDGKVKKFPKELESALTITNIRLKSFESSRLNNYKGFITTTESAAIVSIFGKPVMKQIPTKGFFQQVYSGGRSDKFTLYMHIPGGAGYVFDYQMTKKDGVLEIKTGDSVMNEGLEGMKEEKRKKKNFLYQKATNGGAMTKLNMLFED